MLDAAHAAQRQRGVLQLHVRGRGPVRALRFKLGLHLNAGAFMDLTADISECGLYRYLLTRTWDETLPVCLFIMLNPSTADADVDDPTIRRCMGFARSWRYGGVRVVNLYALRTTDPKGLWEVDDPVGWRNETMIEKEAAHAGLVVCAWGTKGLARAQVVVNLLHRIGVAPTVLRLTKGGHPAHPLYLPKSLKPQPWT